MIIDILTLFPEMFKGPFDESIIKRAQDRGLAEINIHYLRKWTHDKHQTVDDRPFGGGVGMVLKVEPIYEALKELRNFKFQEPRSNQISNSKNQQLTTNSRNHIILLTPQGSPFNQRKAEELSKMDHLIFICGHYEGFDERIREHLIDEEISIGDYILTGGEIPAMVIVDTTVRLIPGVLNKSEAAEYETFSWVIPPSLPNTKPMMHSHPLLEFPQYTHPSEFNGWKVPDILLSGNHKEIEKWKYERSLENTKKKRPDLIKQAKDSK